MLPPGHGPIIGPPSVRLRLASHSSPHQPAMLSCLVLLVGRWEGGVIVDDSEERSAGVCSEATWAYQAVPGLRSTQARDRDHEGDHMACGGHGDSLLRCEVRGAWGGLERGHHRLFFLVNVVVRCRGLRLPPICACMPSRTEPKFGTHAHKRASATVVDAGHYRYLSTGKSGRAGRHHPLDGGQSAPFSDAQTVEVPARMISTPN
ncbi:hypothetical protein QBC34DRAFT_121915 [Podospora aff. communis PSN243]|uniref:Uncharacterized protein n=1 Tax=Podospora aff. communis PSN243 TaxID=3040156 RepID=A0AAV9GIU1_9PEZI|nr:hypothetical protein QBC34DRAFT_121915 [Podospora aff. communis PSN243]